MIRSNKIYPKSDNGKELQDKKVIKYKKTVPKQIIFNNFEGLYDLKNYYNKLYNCGYNVRGINDIEYKKYITNSMFSDFWRGTSKDDILNLPNDNVILTNIRFENLEDINLLESVELIYTGTEIIPTSIFPQLQNFYKMKINQIPFFLFKYGLPLCNQECTLKFNFKKNVEKKDISIIVNVNINYNYHHNIEFKTSIYYVKEVCIYNDYKLLICSTPYFFIPSKKIDDIQLIIEKEHVINLKYDDDKKIVPLVKSLDFNNYWNYMLDFKYIEPELNFKDKHKNKVKFYFVCSNVYGFKDGYGGYMYMH